MMTLEHPLDDESRAFLSELEEFNQVEVAPYADQWDHDEQLPREIFTKAGKIGLMGRERRSEKGDFGFAASLQRFDRRSCAEFAPRRARPRCLPSMSSAA